MIPEKQPNAESFLPPDMAAKQARIDDLADCFQQALLGYDFDSPHWARMVDFIIEPPGSRNERAPMIPKKSSGAERFLPPDMACKQALIEGFVKEFRARGVRLDPASDDYAGLVDLVIEHVHIQHGA